MTGQIVFSVLHQHFYTATVVAPDDQMTFHGPSREITISGFRINNTLCVPNPDTMTPRGIKAEFAALAEEIS